MEENRINAKSFISSIVVIFILMCVCYALTYILPGGEFTRVLDANGNEVIDMSIPFKNVEGGLSFTSFILSPFLVVGMDGGETIIAIIIFLFVIGGIFNCLQNGMIINYLLDKIINKFINSKYKLLSIISLTFMLFGSLMGSFEEIIPLVPIMVALCTSLGFDCYIGLAISILAGSCGFSVGITNPFTIGIAHELAGIPMFSGIWFRIIVFILVYTLLMFFILKYAKKIERKVEINNEFKIINNLEKATKLFVVVMSIGLIIVVLSSVITILQDYTMIITALMFLVGGISACIAIKMRLKDFGKYFLKGALEMLPAAFMILLASSIKYILFEGKILDTILYYLISTLSNYPKWSIVMLVYVIFLIMEVFIASGSAKAFLLLPLLLPITQVFGISSRVAVLAFAFGDGFSNVLYPTNAGLLVGLSLAEVSYPKWFKFSWKFFACNFILTCLLLFFALFIGY